jgi:hypothetical protein
MVDTAREAPADAWHDFDRDELYESIRRDVEDSSEGETASVDEPDTVWQVRGRGLAAAAALVLAVGAALGGWIGVWETSETEPRQQVSEGPSSRKVSGSEARQSVADASALPVLHPADHPSESLRLWVSGGAQWRLHRAGDEATVDVYDGTLLVEFLPGVAGEMTVRTPEYRTSVVGTVFYVRAGTDPRGVGVLEGKVRVRSASGRRYELVGGERLRGREIHPLEPSIRRDARRHINLVAHRAHLAGRSSMRPTIGPSRLGRSNRGQEDAAEPSRTTAAEESARKSSPRPSGAGHRRTPKQGSSPPNQIADRNQPQPSPKSAPESRSETSTAPDSPSPDPEPPETAPEKPRPAQGNPTTNTDTGSTPSIETLRRRANRARHQGEVRRAASLLESALEQTAPDASARADLLLQLGRLQLEHLDHPERAGRYLREFLERWPNDPVASSVRRRLCHSERLPASGVECR